MSADSVAPTGTFQTVEVVATPPEFANPEELLLQGIEPMDARDARSRLIIGLGWFAVGVGLTAAVVTGRHSDAKISVDGIPYLPGVQHAVESIDDGLADIGMVGLPLAAGAIAAAKIGSRYNTRLRQADLDSSQEPNNDGRTGNNIVHRGLRTVGAGSIPVIASAGVAVAAFMSATGTEIEQGPDRPIQEAFSAFPSDSTYSIVVQFPKANPMMESNITRALSANIVQQAANRHITASPIDFYLGTIDNSGQNLDALVVSTEKPDTKLTYNPSTEGCSAVPVAIDKAAGIAVGSHVKISGINVVVTEQTHGLSAINRIGVEADPRVTAECFSQEPDAPHDAVVIEANTKTSNEIVAAADAELGQPATVITKDQFVGNSEEFWKHNAKPLTNTQSVVAGMLSLLSMASIAGSRMLRNRRELATKLAQKVPQNQIRLTETLRALKDGMVASATGVTVAIVPSILVNTIEAGMQVGETAHAAFVGSAVGLLGSVGGSLFKFRKPKRSLDPAKYTRVS